MLFYVKEDQYLFKNPYAIVLIAWVICSEQADPLLMFDLQGGYTWIWGLLFRDCSKAVATIFFAVTKVRLFTVVDDTMCLISLLLTTTGNTITYHNALCLSQQNFA